MRVRWSQLVYRNPGSDNAIGLARVVDTPDGEVLRFAEDGDSIDEFEVGYLALHSLSMGMEEELDEWIEIDNQAASARDQELWGEEFTQAEEFVYQVWTQMTALFRHLQLAR
jgi:hypothetical protein